MSKKPVVNPEAWYSAQQVQKLTGLKTRHYITKYINEGKLLAIQTGGGGESTGTRYSVKGEWILDFMERYKKGMVRGKQYSKEEARARMEEAIAKLK